MAKKIKIKGFLQFFILHELSIMPLSGDSLAEVIGKRKNSVLTPGTIYPTLKRLKKSKLVSWKRDGRKKVYSLTPEGRKELNSLYSELNKFFKGLKKYIK